MPKTVFFDADGTLFELSELIGDVYSRICGNYGLCVSADEIAARIKPTWNVMHPRYINAAGGFTTNAEQERQFWYEFVSEVCGNAIRQSQAFDAIFNDIFNYYSSVASRNLKDGVEAALRQLQQSGFRLGIFSNLDSRILDYVRASSTAKYFEYLFCSVDLGFKKPSLQVFRELEARAGLTALELCYIGNELDLDYQPAKAAGWDAYLISGSALTSGAKVIEWNTVVEGLTQL